VRAVGGRRTTRRKTKGRGVGRWRRRGTRLGRRRERRKGASHVQGGLRARWQGGVQRKQRNRVTKIGWGMREQGEDKEEVGGERERVRGEGVRISTGG